MKTKRIFALAATVLMGATTMSAFSACGGTKVQNEEYDATKANLTVATFDGGVGRAWLDDAAARFEELYKDATNFQEGRTGVNIIVDGSKDKYGGKTLSEKALNKDVYFTEGVDYYDFVNKGKVADITDVLTGSMTTYGESGTIEDKMDNSFKSFMTAGTEVSTTWYLSTMVSMVSFTISTSLNRKASILTKTATSLCSAMSPKEKNSRRINRTVPTVRRVRTTTVFPQRTSK